MPAGEDEGPASRPDVQPVLSEREKIERLIAHVEGLDGAVFIRNDTEHDCREAAEHMRSKWNWKEDEIASAADFIRVAATGSSVSGSPYYIRFSDGRRLKSADYLLQQLARLEQGTESHRLDMP